MGPERHFSGFHGPGNRRGIAAKIAAERTTALAHRAVLAFGPALIVVDLLRLGNVGGPPDDDVAVFVVLSHFLLKVFFHAGHLVRRQKLPVG